MKSAPQAASVGSVYLIAFDIAFVFSKCTGDIGLPQKHLVVHTLRQYDVSKPAYTIYVRPVHLRHGDSRECFS